MSSIAEMITQRLQGPQLQQLAGQIGADEGTTQRAVQTAVPMLLGGMARNTAQPEGQAALGRALQNHDGSLLDDLGGLLGGGGGSAGGAILGHILGGRRDAAAAGVAKSTGLDAGQAGKLLMILAPIVMAALAQRRQQASAADTGAGDAGAPGGGLGDLLQQERDAAVQRAPGGAGALGGLMGMLDRDGDGNPLNDLGKLGNGGASRGGAAPHRVEHARPQARLGESGRRPYVRHRWTRPRAAPISASAKFPPPRRPRSCARSSTAWRRATT